MIALLLPILVRWGVPERFQRLAAWAMGVVTALLLLGALWGGWRLWLHLHDNRVIAADRDAANAIVNNHAAVAGNVASAAQEKRDADFANSQDQLKEKADDAAHNGTDPLDAVFDKLR